MAGFGKPRNNEAHCEHYTLMAKDPKQQGLEGSTVRWTTVKEPTDWGPTVWGSTVSAPPTESDRPQSGRLQAESL